MATVDPNFGFKISKIDYGTSKEENPSPTLKIKIKIVGTISA